MSHRKLGDLTRGQDILYSRTLTSEGMTTDIASVASDLSDHIAEVGMDVVHGATATATASQIITRDSAGRAQVQDPAASLDIANLGYANAQAASAYTYAASAYTVAASAIVNAASAWAYAASAYTVAASAIVNAASAWNYCVSVASTGSAHYANNTTFHNFSVASIEVGDLLYYQSATSKWASLHPSAASYVLTISASTGAASPYWKAAAAGGGTFSSGSSFPGSPADGQPFVLDSEGLHVFDSTASAWIQVGGGANFLAATWADYGSTSSITGWASYTTKMLYYEKLGSMVYVNFQLEGVGTGSIVKFTLPYSCASLAPRFLAFYTDDGIVATNPAVGIMSGSTCSMYSAGLGAWTTTASQTRKLNGQFFYEVA